MLKVYGHFARRLDDPVNIISANKTGMLSFTGSAPSWREGEREFYAIVVTGIPADILVEFKQMIENNSGFYIESGAIEGKKWAEDKRPSMSISVFYKDLIRLVSVPKKGVSP